MIALVGLGLIAGMLTLFSKKEENEPDVVQPTAGDCSTCTGIDDSCEQVCMLEAAIKKAEYYDDEELDRFIGRPSNGYTAEEADEFANVLYTMQPEEVKGWNRSLVVRGINVPDQIKDELITMITD